MIITCLFGTLIAVCILLHYIVGGIERQSLYVSLIVPQDDNGWRAHYSVDVYDRGTKYTLCGTAVWDVEWSKWINVMSNCAFVEDWIGDKLTEEATKQFGPYGDRIVTANADTTKDKR